MGSLPLDWRLGCTGLKHWAAEESACNETRGGNHIGKVEQKSPASPRGFASNEAAFNTSTLAPLPMYPVPPGRAVGATLHRENHCITFGD